MIVISGERLVTREFNFYTLSTTFILQPFFGDMNIYVFSFSPFISIVVFFYLFTFISLFSTSFLPSFKFS